MRDCPKCGARTEIKDSRMHGKYMRRRRACNCGHRFSTIEVPIKGIDRFSDDRLKEQIEWLFDPNEE